METAMFSMGNIVSMEPKKASAGLGLRWGLGRRGILEGGAGRSGGFRGTVSWQPAWAGLPPGLGSQRGRDWGRLSLLLRLQEDGNSQHVAKRQVTCWGQVSTPKTQPRCLDLSGGGGSTSSNRVPERWLPAPPVPSLAPHTCLLSPTAWAAPREDAAGQGSGRPPLHLGASGQTGLPAAWGQRCVPAGTGASRRCPRRRALRSFAREKQG